MEYIPWKSVTLLSVTLEATIVLTYLKISIRRFHLLLHSKIFQHKPPSFDNYWIYTIQLSLFDYCWMIVRWIFPSGSLSSSFEEARASKEYSTNLLGSLQLNKLSISELSLLVSPWVTLGVSQNYRYMILCTNANSFEKELFFKCFNVIEFT